jgi:hypothetical protein
MKNLFLFFVLLGTCLMMTGCGTVSSVMPVANSQIQWQNYQRVLVLDFKDGVTGQMNLAEQPRKKAELILACKNFPDQVAVELAAKNAFREVTRSGNPDKETLVVSGTITRYEEGSAMARLMIGLGAGSAYFDATIDFKDGGLDTPLAVQKVDKNSWGLGGGIAATQTPEGFMRGAAIKLAEDISSLKLTGKLPPKNKPNPQSGAGSR